MVGSNSFVIDGIAHDRHQGWAQLLPGKRNISVGLQSTPIKDNSEGPVDEILLSESYHTRSVKPLKRCIVGGQLLSIERMHSR